MATKHWSWGYFTTDNLLFRNNHFYKNAWCIACIEFRKEQLRQADVANTAASGISSGQTDADWEAQGGHRTGLFSPMGLTDCFGIYIACRDCPPISGKPGQSMVPHLSKCVFVGPEVRSRAVEEIDGKKICRQNLSGTIGHSTNVPLRLPAIMTGFGHPNPSTSRSTTPFGSPSPSLLLMSTPLLNFERPPKRPRVSSVAGTNTDDSQSPTGRVWNPVLQQEFGEDFCRLLIATHSSWNTAHNPQVQSFVEKWIPGAIIPDRRTLSGPILDREAVKVEDKLKLKLKGQKATFQVDGWKNKAKHAIIATMVSVDFEVSSVNTKHIY